MENGSNGSALAVVENSLDANVGVLMRRATDVAGVCREIVMKTALTIQQRKYVRVEGWQAIAVAYGCIASARDVENVYGNDGKLLGVRATGEVRRMSDGVVVSTAEGFVGVDEPTWFGGESNGRKLPARAMYAVRAMAQTRSESRACRGAFSFVVTLIDSNLATTPAEEMEGIARGSETPPAPLVTKPAPVAASKMEQLKEALRPQGEPPAHTDADFRADPPHDAKTGEVKAPTHDRNFVMPFANKDNKALHALSEKDLAWYHKTLTGNLTDPSKAAFVDRTRQQLELINAERTFRGI